MSVYHEKKLKLKHFQIWKNYLLDIKLEIINENKAEKHYFKLTCGKPFTHWKIVSIFVIL